MSYMEMKERLQELDRLAKTASNSHASRCEPKKLIDANSIQYHKTTECHGHGLFFTEQIAYKEEIEQIPAIDAVEVVHGRWNRKQIGKYTGTDEVVCSCCGYFLAVVGTDIGFKEAIKDMNYCPNCGAKMDVKEGSE